MPVTYLITFDVKPERVETFLEMLTEVLDAMRNEPMFYDAMLHRDPDNAHRFMLHETWESHDDVLSVQLNRAYRQAYHRALPELLAREREISVWSRTRVDRRPG